MDSTHLSSQIDKILRSSSFANKRQLRKLLKLLHQKMDSPATVTPELVIKELWPNEIRTKRSTDVATEMNRLRHALKSYYQEEGSSDQIMVVLPNRAANAGNGNHEGPWMIARPRGEIAAEDAEQSEPAAVDLRGRRKRPGIVVVIATVLGIAVYVSFHMLAMRPQPQSARFDGTVLRVMDANGKELWNKNFPDGFGPDWFYGKDLGQHIWFGDLEGNGHTSVLFVYSPASPESHPSTLICYSDRGEEKWLWNPGRELPELNGNPAAFKTMAMGVLKATPVRPRRIVVSSQYWPWWANQIAVLDSNGKTISEYWHSGTLGQIELADLDGDGREEIVATGVANGYDHQATLVVLDPDRTFGASTEILPEFQIHGMGNAQEKLRLLFPRSDLNRALFQFNIATDPSWEQGSLRLKVAECINPVLPHGCEIWYEFDKNSQLIAAFAGGDEFRSAHERFFQTGKNAHTLSEQEKAEFQKVRCLVGCKSEFVPVGKLVP